MNASLLRSSLSAALFCLVSTVSVAETTIWQIAEFDIPEANQGIGVDEDHFYAVDNHTIAKYTKDGEYVDAWIGEDDGQVKHLDSAAVVDGKIYCSHSNYRYFPMTSSIEVWDAETMKHIESHSIGIRLGSLTWLDKHDGYWWGTFANYNKEGKLPDGTKAGVPYAIHTGGNINTTLVKFNEDWQVLEGWIFPTELMEKFELMSNSGGSWGPDGKLYITGHDLAETYQIRFPEAGSVLEVAETISLNIRGQGIAWDHSEEGVLYGIIRANDEEEAQGMTNRVVVFASNLTQENKPEECSDRKPERRHRRCDR
ncbi:MAG: hypothetical protein ABW139_06955 [Candidatus Thiodiazotropha sp. DIVDIV]